MEKLPGNREVRQQANSSEGGLNMMRLVINFLIVLKTIGRPLNYEDLDFEILHV